MKRYLSTVLAVVTTVFLATGCGKNPTQPTVEKMEVPSHGWSLTHYPAIAGAADWGFVIWFFWNEAKEYIEGVYPYVDIWDGLPGLPGSVKLTTVEGYCMTKPEGAKDFAFDIWEWRQSPESQEIRNVDPGMIFEAIIIVPWDWRVHPQVFPMVGWGPVDRSQEPDSVYLATPKVAGGYLSLRPPDRIFALVPVDLDGRPLALTRYGMR